MSRRQCHVLVTGRVQGVFYRASTVSQAQAFGLDGWVRNRRDGSVEAVLGGDALSVQRMLDWMRRGPAQARVESVTASEHDGPLAAGFIQRDTV